MNMHCIIIEDEPLAIEKLKGFILQVPFLELDGYFENAIDGLTYLKTHSTDLIFLDIQMDKLTGIQMLEILSPKPYIIITSAYSEFALKGYELSVTDYLLKPYSFERFLASVNRVFDSFSSHKDIEPKDGITNFFVKTEYRLENVKFDNILYIEGMQNYLQIHLPNRKIMTKQSFRSIMEQLPKQHFVQVHKSYVVQLSKIESIENNRIKIADAIIPIGDTFRNTFFERIKSKV
jgi:two-component system, LytTR family, response regulator